MQNDAISKHGILGLLLITRGLIDVSDVDELQEKLSFKLLNCHENQAEYVTNCISIIK